MHYTTKCHSLTQALGVGCAAFLLSTVFSKGQVLGASLSSTAVIVAEGASKPSGLLLPSNCVDYSFPVTTKRKPSFTTCRGLCLIGAWIHTPHLRGPKQPPAIGGGSVLQMVAGA